jgi:hypothetical protein
VLLVDRARETYARWGLGRFDRKVLLKPGLFWAMLKVLVQQTPMRLTPHHYQLGGDFVVDPSGKLVFVNRMRTLYDRAHVREMLASLRTT